MDDHITLLPILEANIIPEARCNQQHLKKSSLIFCFITVWVLMSGLSSNELGSKGWKTAVQVRAGVVQDSTSNGIESRNSCRAPVHRTQSCKRHCGLVRLVYIDVEIGRNGGYVARNKTNKRFDHLMSSFLVRKPKKEETFTHCNPGLTVVRTVYARRKVSAVRQGTHQSRSVCVVRWNKRWR